MKVHSDEENPLIGDQTNNVHTVKSNDKRIKKACIRGLIIISTTTILLIIYCFFKPQTTININLPKEELYTPSFKTIQPSSKLFTKTTLLTKTTTKTTTALFHVYRYNIVLVFLYIVVISCY